MVHTEVYSNRCPATAGDMAIRVDDRLPRCRPETKRRQRAAEIGALVLAVDLAPPAGLDRERVGELLGLTPRESYLAVALAEGRTVSDVARETRRSENTVRWHLHRIYTKLGLALGLAVERNHAAGARIEHHDAEPAGLHRDRALG